MYLKYDFPTVMSTPHLSKGHEKLKVFCIQPFEILIGRIHLEKRCLGDKSNQGKNISQKTVLRVLQ